MQRSLPDKRSWHEVGSERITESGLRSQMPSPRRSLSDRANESIASLTFKPTCLMNGGPICESKISARLALKRPFPGSGWGSGTLRIFTDASSQKQLATYVNTCYFEDVGYTAPGVKKGTGLGFGRYFVSRSWNKCNHIWKKPDQKFVHRLLNR